MDNLLFDDVRAYEYVRVCVRVKLRLLFVSCSKSQPKTAVKLKIDLHL